MFNKIDSLDGVFRMRFTVLIYKKTRKEATASKLKSAKRRLLKEQEKYPLLVDWIIEQQPTPEEKVDRQLDSWQHWCQNMRDFQAQQWCKGRALLRSLPVAEQVRFLVYWNNSSIPSDSSYFCDALNRFSL
jgi:hypothetical protein